MGKSFVPLAGDFKAINRDYVAKGRYIGDYLLDNYRETKQEGSASYTLFHVGESVQLWINDPKMQAELVKYIPDKIDRYRIDAAGFDRIKGDFKAKDVLSTKLNVGRRQLFVKSMGISFASRFIPIILKECEKIIDSMDEKKSIDMSDKAS